MTSESNVDNVAQDSFQETVAVYASKLLERGAEALRGVAKGARALASAADDRAASFKSMLANLDTLNTSVYQQLSSLESSKLSTEARALAETYRREIGKAEGSVYVRSAESTAALSPRATRDDDRRGTARRSLTRCSLSATKFNCKSVLFSRTPAERN